MWSGAQNDTFSIVWSTRSPFVSMSTTLRPSPFTYRIALVDFFFDVCNINNNNDSRLNFTDFF